MTAPPISFFVADRRFSAVIFTGDYIGDAELRQYRRGFHRIACGLYFANGGEYSGEIIFERPYGQGTLTLADGTVKEGF